MMLECVKVHVNNSCLQMKTQHILITLLDIINFLVYSKPGPVNIKERCNKLPLGCSFSPAGASLWKRNRSHLRCLPDAGQTPWDISCPHWAKTGPTRGSQDFTTKSASECNPQIACQEQNSHVCNFFIHIKCRPVALALCFSATGMDTSSCTARRGPSAWLT